MEAATDWVLTRTKVRMSEMEKSPTRAAQRWASCSACIAAKPRLDRMAGSVPGMSVTVGRLRNGIDDRSLQLTLLSHNTIRGAAGTAILTAELMEREGYIG